MKQPIVPVATESTQTVEIRAKTPRQFSASFLRLIDKLKELSWFDEQYPLIKIEVRPLLILFDDSLTLFSIGFPGKMR